MPVKKARITPKRGFKPNVQRENGKDNENITYTL